MKLWSRSELKALFEEWWATKMERSTISTPSEEVEAQDTVQGAHAEEGESAGNMPLLRIEPFGYFGVPMPNEPCCTLVRYGDNGFTIALGSARYKPQHTKRGEAGLYCSEPGTSVWLKNDKSLEIQSASGAKLVLDKNGSLKMDAVAGKNVVINGGTLPVARITDQVDGGKLKMVVASVGPPPALNVTLLYTPPGGMVATVVGSFVIPNGTGTSGAVEFFGEITTGASHFTG